MGNFISSGQDTESLNWDKINTESMSASIPYLQSVSKDAQKLVEQLNFKNNLELEESESDNIWTWLNQDSKPVNNVASEDFSDTSPFISSDMYNYLVNESSSDKNHEQEGGNDNSTSTTSSSERKNKRTKHNQTRLESSEQHFNGLSSDNLSYISSSAHTDHLESSVESDSSVKTTVSNENKDRLSSSINTDDINLVSAESM